MELEVTKAVKKVLFVGEERICRQVAYVLGFEDYELADKLTEESYAKYQSYKIYVCEFKRKSKSIVDKVLLKNKEINYLENICREIDKEHKEYRLRYEKKSAKKLSIKSMFYNFLRYCWHNLKAFRTMYYARRYLYHKIKNDNIQYLRYLKASELFLFVLRAPINENINCSILETELQVSVDDIRACCAVAVPFGSLLEDKTLYEIYDGTYARIIKLSSINHSFCLCNLSNRCKKYSINPIKKDIKISCKSTRKIPTFMALSIDPTCNLCCKSCRNQYYTMDEKTNKNINLVTNKLIDSKILNEASSLMLAGLGEVFYSPYYRTLLDNNVKRKNIEILSNGILFNEENWNWLKPKFEDICVTISVDAATEGTYKKLRGADFNQLMKNLEMLADLRRQGKIRKFNLNYVVQRDNFREMPEFVLLGKKLGVDMIEFQHMNNFGNLSKKQHQQRCLIIDDKYLDYELWQVLQDPIFKDPIVDLSGFNRYLIASAEKYQNFAKVEEVK